MTSTIKVNNIQNQCGANIINENSNTITIGASGDTIALASGASQTGFGRTGTVDWQTTPKTATFTAVSGEGYFANTSGSAFNMNLPAGVAGAIVSVADYAESFNSNNLTVVPNGTDKIGSLNENATLSTKGQSVTFVFVDSTQGWINTMDSTSNVRGQPPFISATGGTITCSGNCKIHTFTGPGTFTVSSIAGCAANNAVSYLVVAGGGAGGGQHAGGGGGAGGFRELKTPVAPYTASPLDGYPSAPNRIIVSAQGYPIVVGAGGSPVPGGCNSNRGGTGNASSFSTITSAGGAGGGAGGGVNRPINPGTTGGSGSGAMGNCGGSSNPTGGAGNTPPVTPPQGNPGGNASSSGPAYGSGGGGGAGEGGPASGVSGTSSAYGRGAVGVPTQISGSALSYAGGGGGGTFGPYPAPGGGASPCGTGGQGAGTSPGGTGGVGGAGTTNRGGGGGGGSDEGPFASGAGGSGIVVIRYKFQ